MRSYTVFGLPLVVAVSGVAALDNWRDYEWSYRADKTAEWYKAHRQPLPELAPEISIVEPRKSYVVKLDCIACPFRVREYGQLGESWQEPPQDNSLLLNFTVDDSKPGLLLNGHRIAPLDPMPLGISAYQTPANLSKEIMGKMTSMHMLDKSWVVGTKYGSFELQYVHSVVRTKEPGKTWIQFDVTNAYVSHGPAGQATLDKEGQKMVQILLHQEKPCKKATIEAIQVIERNDRVKPYRMKCGKLAMFQTEFNPLEWDYYGKFGTWSRTWHLYLWQSGEFLESNALVLILVALGTGIFSLVRWHKRQQQAKAADQAREDAETALLEGECEDDYPYYADIPEIKIEEWSG